MGIMPLGIVPSTLNLPVAVYGIIIIKTNSLPHANIHAGYACCGPADAPTIDDSCFTTAMQTAGLSTAGLSWRPPQSCSAVDEYEVVYTQCACNASDSTKTRMRIQHIGSVILTSLETYNYCIHVRAVINETCNSGYSTCVQVGSMEEGM